MGVTEHLDAPRLTYSIKQDFIRVYTVSVPTHIQCLGMAHPHVPEKDYKSMGDYVNVPYNTKMHVEFLYEF